MVGHGVEAARNGGNGRAVPGDVRRPQVRLARTAPPPNYERL